MAGNSKAPARGHGGVVSERFWRIAVLTAAVATGAASRAEAAYFWWDSEPGFSRPAPAVSPRRYKPRRHAGKKIEIPEAAKPQGPLIIAISIDQQRLKIYDGNGFYAETPISTGMSGHPTPMGVFSVIQKHKMHHSNIYSGAPMPFMQRITWSGVAMHAGVLPGYPASHGCIRMPTAFAAKMWNWTRMGARVVITPGEMTPARFSHPLLAEQKAIAQPVAADEPREDLRDKPGADTPAAAKADKAADAGTKPAVSSLELRSTIGHGTQTADASSALPAANTSLTMSDATPSGGKASLREEIPVQTGSAPGVTGEAKAEDSKTDTARTQGSRTEASKADAAEKAGDSVTVATDADTGAADPKTQDVKKDEARMPGGEKPDAGKPAPAAAAAPRRSGQIAVFISRKDNKLYVRQNFAPLFDAPVTIAPDDRPLGTHVFTARLDKDNSNRLNWSVVSLPAPARYAERRDDDDRASRRHKMAGGVAEIKPMPVPNSPAEALDRLTIPADAMARITEALTTGGSIIVSDQGIGTGETGEGTDFIVSLR
jgi:lipoprotein-anchoring transpeptidase ErfK/SrfK